MGCDWLAMTYEKSLHLHKTEDHEWQFALLQLDTEKN